jgi:hypothetical protein
MFSSLADFPDNADDCLRKSALSGKSVGKIKYLIVFNSQKVENKKASAKKITPARSMKFIY